ncbi:subtilase-type protease inhibitor [Streptosporangium sp. NBC_01810]|uniref:SSI family serine proteinase inhibitor n=1 Tax=Streptosporangium sp. NBC_01810 TaxID=2975951 RepID=UPI002DDB8E3C|nr:SSI family serine proteinase inhibitor [Streptosporangium sp. NBC_01810]WSA25208.1 subtilase-type protease inhibitor [Streptosporangium sp. NBC_01810]
MKQLAERMIFGVAFLGAMTTLSALPADADSLGEPMPSVSDVPGVSDRPDMFDVPGVFDVSGELSARALVLTASQGPVILPPARAVVLQCSPIGGGTHPNAREACTALEPANGDVRKLKPSPGSLCPLNYEPVTVSAVGVWNSRFTMSSRTFGNSCQMHNALGVVGSF